MQTNTMKCATLALLLLAVSFSACKKDETTEQELITTVLVRLATADGSPDQIFEWDDPDGDGGVAPTIDNILLNSGVSYTCEIEVYDRSQTPEANITAEIKAENTAHLFVFTPDVADVTVIPTDQDDNGDPFRLKTSWVAGATSIGSMTITLKHEPDKGAANLDSTGETDFEVTFPVRIQ